MNHGAPAVDPDRRQQSRLSVVAVLMLIVGASAFSMVAPATSWGQDDPFEDDAKQKPKSKQQQSIAEYGVVTIDDKTIAARPTELHDGNLTLGGTGILTVPLEEVARIDWGPSAEVAVDWIGQENQYVIVGDDTAAGEKPRDIHLRLTNLRSDRRVRQVVVRCGGARWSLQPVDARLAPELPRQPSGVAAVIGNLIGAITGAKNESDAVDKANRLPMVLRRLDGCDTADLFLRPPKGDLFGKKCTISIGYDESGTARVATTASTHTDASLPVDPSKEPGDGSYPIMQVLLPYADRLHGTLKGWTETELSIKTRWNAEIGVPLLGVRGLKFNTVASQSTGAFEKQLASPDEQDHALVLAADGTVASVAGAVKGVIDGKLQFEFEGQLRRINLHRLVGVVFAVSPPSTAGEAPYQVFSTRFGDRISGRWQSLGDGDVKLTALWGRDVVVGVNMLNQTEFRNGRLIYLSDLEPIEVSEVPYFGRPWKFRRDTSLTGEPLRMAGLVYQKGLAVHSRSVLSFALEGRFEVFKTTLGFDDRAGELGHVACRVLCDGKELFSMDLAADSQPVPLELSTAGVRRLTLEVDFGKGQHVGDRIIWADARLLRTKVDP